MAIATGTRFNHYEILAPLGAGGMGEVHLAEDTRLHRKVALKLLPEEFTRQAERVRRFEQEARAASALNHPNILTIHEIGEANGAHFIATEFIDGQTLRARMVGDRLSLSVALDLAIQTASALAAAHTAGIIHRDIKPENVMLRRDGIVKVLDFGLAKLTEQRPAAVDSEAPTIAKVNTDPGTVMGTANYMSPEQARGQEVDARSDIFSLGLVLYEMIAGRAPFTGLNAIEVLGAILNQEPAPLKSQMADVPAELQRIISKALRKDRDERYQHVEDLLLDLKDLKQELEFEAKLKGAQPFVVPPSGGSVETREIPPEGGTTNAQPAEAATNEVTAARATSSAEIILGEIRRHKLGAGIALVIFLIAVAGLVFALYRLSGQKHSTSRASGPAPRIVPFTSYPGNEHSPSFSPDGNQIAFVMTSGERVTRSDIYVKLIDAGAPLRLTTQAGNNASPAWSPDGRYIAYVRRASDERGIFLVPALGGAARALYLTTTNVTGPTWSPDGKLLAFSERSSPTEPWGVFLLNVESQEKRRLTSSPVGTLGDSTPAFSPDGKTLAFTRANDPSGAAEIYLVATVGGEPKQLTFDNRETSGGLAWTADGREIVFSLRRDGGNFSLWRLPITGGAPERLALGPDSAFTPAISRQGNRLAYTLRKADLNIWRYDASGSSGRNSAPTKLVASTLYESGAQYSSDGQRIVFTSGRSGNLEIWVCESDGEQPRQVTSFGGGVGSPRWSPDGRQITFDALTGGQRDIYIVGVSGGKPRRITTETSEDIRPSWSQDGKWIYFGSNRSGNLQVWKAPVEGGPAVQVTRQGGVEPCESPDGQYVYYTKARGLTSLWRVPFSGGEEVQVLDQVLMGYWAGLSQGIYFINLQATPRPRIEFFSFATTRITPIAAVEKNIAGGPPGFSVSPDGRWVLLAIVDQSDSDIMLMENFR